MKINYHKISRTHGLSLFELVLTITISSIIFTILMLFVNSTLNTIQQLSFNKKFNNSHKVVLNILNEDLLNNTGNLQLVKDDNSNILTLSFNLPDPNNANSNIIVSYIYDENYRNLYRKLGNENSKLLLNNVNNCTFTNMLSTNMTNMTVTVNMLIEQQNTTVNLYEVIHVFYPN